MIIIFNKNFDLFDLLVFGAIVGTIANPKFPYLLKTFLACVVAFLIFIVFIMFIYTSIIDKFFSPPPLTRTKILDTFDLPTEWDWSIEGTYFNSFFHDLFEGLHSSLFWQHSLKDTSLLKDIPLENKIYLYSFTKEKNADETIDFIDNHICNQLILKNISYQKSFNISSELSKDFFYSLKEFHLQFKKGYFFKFEISGLFIELSVSEVRDLIYPKNKSIFIFLKIYE